MVVAKDLETSIVANARIRCRIYVYGMPTRHLYSTPTANCGSQSEVEGKNPEDAQKDKKRTGKIDQAVEAFH